MPTLLIPQLGANWSIPVDPSRPGHHHTSLLFSPATRYLVSTCACAVACAADATGAETTNPSITSSLGYPRRKNTFWYCTMYTYKISISYYLCAIIEFKTTTRIIYHSTCPGVPYLLQLRLPSWKEVTKASLWGRWLEKQRALEVGVWYTCPSSIVISYMQHFHA